MNILPLSQNGAPLSEAVIRELRASLGVEPLVGTADPHGVVGVKASTTIDLSALVLAGNFTEGDSISVNNINFTAMDTLSDPAVTGEFQIETDDLGGSWLNFISTLASLVPEVTISADVETDPVVIEAVNVGTAGNSIPVSALLTTEDVFATETLVGGVDAIPAVTADAGTVYSQLDGNSELVAVWVSNGDGSWKNIPIGNVPRWQVLTESEYTALEEADPSEVDANILYFTVADPET